MGGTADLAIDLGSSNTRVALRGRGVVYEQPTAIAIRKGPRGPEVIAVGKAARRMIGRTPAEIEVLRPVRNGLIADFQSTDLLLKHILKAVGARGLRKPRILVCIPTDTTEVERRAVQECVRSAGAREVLVVATAMAAAIGCGIPVRDPSASLVVDIGGGRTDVGIISLGGMVVRRSLPVAGLAFDAALVHWTRVNHALLVAEATAEALKWRVGMAAHTDDLRSMRVRGRDLPTSAPREVDITTHDTAEALHDAVARIRDVVLDALRQAPPEVSSDVHDRGLVLCGGGGELGQLDRVLSDATGLPVVRPELPERAVALGAAVLLDDPELLARVSLSL